MDPSTTLFTFMLETHPSVQTVSLVGSWDNFTKPYAMERDSRRDRGQWRGCHTFKGIVCDGDRPGSSRRNGGLKMGQAYYFYYELDGSVETHDPTRPSTSACPFLPGQTVNTMWVPNEMSSRIRRASVSSVRDEDFKTMEPDHKFTTPRPAPVVPAIPDFLGPAYRLPTAHPQTLEHKTSERSMSRSISPTPSWWSPRKLFTRRRNNSSSQDSGDEGSVCSEEPRCSMTSLSRESGRVRAMSPDSLRRFLSEEAVEASEPESTARLALAIPDDIVEEDDDEFVAASAVSEYGPRTILSPPPPVSRQGVSSNTLSHPAENSSAVTIRGVQQLRPRFLESTTFYQQPYDETEDLDTPTSRFSFSSEESSIVGDDDEDEVSPTGDNEVPSFYHSDAEDDDETDCLSPPPGHGPKRPGLVMGRESLEHSLAEAFEGYCLPRTSIEGSSKPTSAAHEASEAPVSVLSSPPLLALPVMDDLASELKSAGLSF